MALTIISSLLLPLLSLSYFIAAANSCNCYERPASFEGCAKRPADFKSHTHHDIGLEGDCLPTVPVNEMRCFKWRTAEECDGENHLRCTLSRRKIAEKRAQVETTQTLAVMKSPGYRADKQKPSYFNNNFCIYNISLSCSQGQNIRLHSTDATPFDDSVDYLWFSEQLQSSHGRTLSGDKTVNFVDYIDAHSFHAILWTNSKSPRGKFELVAECSGTEGSGENLESN